MFANWKEVLDTANLSPEREMDSVSKWLIITRAAVFAMTATSALIGGLLALVVVGDIDWSNFALAFLGLIIAHAANKMNNDFFDMAAGVDTDDYARAQYAPHPVLSGLISRSTLGRAILLFNLLDAAILLVLFLRTDWPVLLFALAGLLISVFYVAPPIRLKHIGLGELGVFLVWGPLMIGGTYFVAAGVLPTAEPWLSMPIPLVSMGTPCWVTPVATICQCNTCWSRWCCSPSLALIFTASRPVVAANC